MPTGLNSQQISLLKRAGYLYSFDIIYSYNIKENEPKPTHIITNVKLRRCLRTYKYMLGISLGCWILSFQWIKDLMNKHMFPNEIYYEVIGDQTSPSSGGPAKSRTRDRDMKLFEGKEFFLNGPFSGLPQQELEVLIDLNGGTCVNRINSSVYILADQKTYNSKKKLKNTIVDSLWILACLSAYEIVEIEYIFSFIFVIDHF